jgi:hypothetical protein
MCSRGEGERTAGGIERGNALQRARVRIGPIVGEMTDDEPAVGDVVDYELAVAAHVASSARPLRVGVTVRLISVLMREGG